MKLNELRNNPGAHRHKFKLGRGSSSGLGKTSGLGVKGAKARTGTKVYGFEGGQMPLHMRTPKRGFNNIFALDFSEVNVGLLQKALDDKRLKNEGRITEQSLKEAGLARASRHGVRLLGKGLLAAKIEVEVAGVSAGARAAVEKAGGSVNVTFRKRISANRKGEAGKRQKRRAAAATKRAAREKSK